MLVLGCVWRTMSMDAVFDALAAFDPLGWHTKHRRSTPSPTRRIQPKRKRPTKPYQKPRQRAKMAMIVLLDSDDESLVPPLPSHRRRVVRERTRTQVSRRQSDADGPVTSGHQRRIQGKLDNNFTLDFNPVQWVSEHFPLDDAWGADHKYAEPSSGTNVHQIEDDDTWGVDHKYAEPSSGANVPSDWNVFPPVLCKQHQIEDDNTSACAICQSVVAQGTWSVLTHCCHYFCMPCLKTWESVERKQFRFTCPTCRKSLVK